MTYDDLISGGTAAVADLIGKQEALSLEFKSNNLREPIFDAGELTNPGKKILAKACSAFANSAGGVLVFGVVAVNRDGVDQATGLTPIENIRRAETSVRDAAADLLQPRHDGIRVASIYSSPDADDGFLVVDVPRSDRRPHRSEARGQKEYFKRIGSRSYPMEHYDIEDAFRRTSSPSLLLRVSTVQQFSVGSEAVFTMILGLENDSQVSAKSISLQIWDRKGHVFNPETIQPVPDLTSTHYQGRQHLAAGLGYVIHPGEARAFYKFEFRAKRDLSAEPSIGMERFTNGSIGFSYAIAAENMRSVEQRYAMLRDDFAPVFRYFKMD
ncbi:AlbA family DNA-binding domain-containing protein [Shinella sp. BE166]|uniref:AlbA family DNA-binding domain-containing protein n=1 Tax=unclassified Shinella TaxID=2643062 RepID=UPI003EB860D7